MKYAAPPPPISLLCTSIAPLLLFLLFFLFFPFFLSFFFSLSSVADSAKTWREHSLYNTPRLYRFQLARVPRSPRGTAVSLERVFHEYTRVSPPFLDFFFNSKRNIKVTVWRIMYYVCYSIYAIINLVQLSSSVTRTNEYFSLLPAGCVSFEREKDIS